MTKPKPYDPATYSIPWWWHWGGIRDVDGRWLATWWLAKRRRRRAKVARRKLRGKLRGTRPWKGNMTTK